MNVDSPIRKYRHAVSVVIIVSATILMGLARNESRGPVADELNYLALGYSLHAHDIYGLALNPEISPEASGGVVPLYPVFLAAMMRIDPPFAESVRCYLREAQGVGAGKCPTKDKLIKYTQLVIAGLGLSALWFTARAISGSALIGVIAVILCLLAGAPTRFANHFLTEAVYIPLLFLFLALSVWAIRKPTVVKFAIAGLTLSLLALSRPTFYYFFFLSFPLILWAVRACPTTPGASFLRSVRPLIVPLVAYVLAYSLPIGAWIARNAVVLGVPSLSVGYGALGLAQRVAYNDMNPAEYAAGWIYWVPDFGDKLAIKLFGQDTIDRLRLDAEKGFYNVGNTALIAEVEAATGARVGSFQVVRQGQSPENWLIENKVLNRIPVHVATTVLLAWRGVFVEKYFGIVGLIAMVWALSGGLRDAARQDVAILAAPGIVLLFFNAAVSIGIPRYNLPLMMPMAICIAFAVQRVVAGCKTWVEKRFVRHDRS